MKKNFSFIWAAMAVCAIFFSCAKENAENDINGDNSQNGSVVEEVTVTATLADMTKVGFTPSYGDDGKPESMALVWEDGDRLRVYDHDDRTKYDDFSLDAAYIGQKKGVFVGKPVNVAGAQKYDVEVVGADGFSYTQQVQPSDGVTTGLKYIASASALDSYSTVQFTDFSSVLALTVKLPEGVAAKIKSVDLKASEKIFDGAENLTITLTEVGDANDDGILHVFATLPQGRTEIPAGTTLVMHFNAPGETHDIYTRFVELGSVVSFVESKMNAININALNSAAYANASSNNIGTEANPYLIGDKWQFDAIRNELSEEMRYFEMVDDIDMTGIAWNPLNTVQTTCFHFEGNDYTISNVTSAQSQYWQSIFGLLTGTIQNLKVDRAVMVPGDKYSGVLVSHLGASSSSVKSIVKNVTITNSTLGTADYKGSNNFGILAGCTENPHGVEISDVTISDCSVATTGYAGAMIGRVSATVSVSGINQIIRTDVCGSRAGGAIGHVGGSITMSGCTYSGGTVSATVKNLGGMIGIAESSYASEISDCHVSNATIDASGMVPTNWLACGGFIGQSGNGMTVKGCTVGSEKSRVVIKLADSAEGEAVNAGGFAGIAYGTFTKNGEARNKAYVNITCANTDGAKRMNIGGFAGYHEDNTIEYSDADVIIENMAGTHIGGFVGAEQGGEISNCTASGTITSTGKIVGGFIGGSDTDVACEITGNRTSVNVSATDTAGGFVGLAVGKYTSNCATGTVSTTSGYGGTGGFAGTNAGSSTTFSRNYATGDVSAPYGSQNVAGMIGYVASSLSMNDCYATGNVGGVSGSTPRKASALVGQTSSSEDATISISNCYASGDVYGYDRVGGLIGYMYTKNVVLEKCAAWSNSVGAEKYTETRYSVGAVVGTAFPSCTITDCYRNPDMKLTAYWVPDKTFQHPDVSAESTLTTKDGTHMEDNGIGSGQPHYPQYPYHGKVDATRTLSALARDVLGWSAEIWDFSKELPTLK